VTSEHARDRPLMGFLCVRGDLNTHLREISPIRGYFPAGHIAFLRVQGGL
jgi:hypothetical protein